MNSKLQESGISLDELLRPSAPEMDLNQPVDPVPPPSDIDPPRSTVDPFAINFATADIADKLHNSRTSVGMKIFALILFGVPTVIGGVWLIAMAWSDPRLPAINALFDTLLGLAFAGFWPYVIFVNRRANARSS